MDFYDPVDPKRKRRWIGPVVLLGVLLGLIVTAFFMAEHLVRGAAVGVVSKPIVSALNLTSSDDVAIDFGSGSLILQAVTGSIDEVTVTASDVPFGTAGAEVRLVATGVPLDTAGTVARLEATAMLDAAAVQSLGEAFAADPLTISLGATTLDLESTVDVAGVPTPAVLEVTPSISEGSLVFRVISISVGGQDVPVDDVLAGTYGPAAAAAATPPSLCVAQFLPAGLTVSGASVVDGALLIEAAGERIALSSNDFTTLGRCDIDEEPAP